MLGVFVAAASWGVLLCETIDWALAKALAEYYDLALGELIEAVATQ